MKKLLSILLLLCLLCPAAMADANDIYVAESYVNEYTDGESLHIHVVFVIENRGKSVFLPMSAAVVLMNKNNEVFEESIVSMYPMAVPAGEKSYVHGVFTLDAAQQAQYDHSELYLGLIEYSKDEMELATQLCAAQVFPSVTAQVNGTEAVITVKNDTVIDLTVAGLLILYKNEEGKIVGVAEEFVSNLPMGGAIDVNSAFTLAPFASVEVVCFSMPM